MAADEDWMRLALEMARRAAGAGEVPVGAIVELDGRVIGSGWNSPISRSDPTAHAEILAIRSAAETIGNYRLERASLYCTVEPCLMCCGAALHARLSRVIFGASDPKVGATARIERLYDEGVWLNHRVETRGGVLADEAAELLLSFFRERRTGADDA